MPDLSDHMAKYHSPLSDEFKPAPVNFAGGWWRTREGVLIHVSKMENSHLLNIARFLLRKAQAYISAKVTFYITCDGPRGEMAEVAFESESNYWFDLDAGTYLATHNPFWGPLVDEIIKRNLEVPNA